MANNFRNKIIKNVGTQPVEVLSVGPAVTATIVGLSLTNLIPGFVYIDILVQDESSVEGFYLRETILPENSSLRAVTNGEKLILGPDTRVSVRSSEDDSVDVIVSYVETI
jgi:hypothetical protein